MTIKIANIPVLIIGSGSTRLMAAAQLQRFGVPFQIIEKRHDWSQRCFFCQGLFE